MQEDKNLFNQDFKVATHGVVVSSFQTNQNSIQFITKMSRSSWLTIRKNNVSTLRKTSGANRVTTERLNLISSQFTCYFCL